MRLAGLENLSELDLRQGFAGIALPYKPTRRGADAFTKVDMRGRLLGLYGLRQGCVCGGKGLVRNG